MGIQPLFGHLKASRYALNELKAESLVITVLQEVTEPKKKMPFHPPKEAIASGHLGGDLQSQEESEEAIAFSRSRGNSSSRAAPVCRR